MLTAEYVAGFFDGEGTVGITKSGYDKHVYLRVSVSNTNLGILHTLKAQFGGFLSLTGKKKPNWKASGEWIIGGKAAAEFLRFIEPFVILKKSQVVLGLEFWSFQKKPLRERCNVISGPNTHTRVQRKPETIAKEIEFKSQMSVLNKKGSEVAA